MTRVNADLAKRVIQAHAVDASGKRVTGSDRLGWVESSRVELS